jgi:hypothetical protein
MNFLRPFVILFVILLGTSCSNDEPDPISGLPGNDPATKWADVTLKTIRNSFPNSPTYTSRSLGYIGLTMYETLVNGSTIHKSLAGQLNGFTLDVPLENGNYNWVAAMNAGQAQILRSLYPHATTESLDRIDSLEQAIYYVELEKENDPDVITRSVTFGKQVASAIYNWSTTDGGHEGYLHHFDYSYVFPQGESYWFPPQGGQTVSAYPLHPHWGNNRTFIKANQTLPVPAMLPYSTDVNSPYYLQFKEVYKVNKLLTAEQRNTAAWWSDDPTQTASPPGHSYNLATIAIRTAKADIYTAAETYAKVGMSVADSFICCWRAKYTYHSQRPFGYIRTNIDPNYEQFWPEPPFPAFPSGHATQSSAAAKALVSIYGEFLPIYDTTHKNRATDFTGVVYEPRFFATISATAEECAYSRLLGGIHTRQDNEKGAKQGEVIGQNVVGLQWKK